MTDPSATPAPAAETQTLAPRPPSDVATMQPPVSLGRATLSAPTVPGAMPTPNIPGYEILAELGRGGMGVVYKARHLKLNRIVALKMILAGGHASHAELVRFLVEAEAVAALTHPNIVQIYQVDHHDGLPFFTLEYVPG